MAQAETGKTLEPSEFANLLYRTCVCGGVVGCAATLYQIIGLAGYLNQPGPKYLVIGVVLGATGYSLARFLCARPAQLAGRALWFGVLVFVAIGVLLGTTPPTARDELTHHLAIPRLYAERGAIFEIPFSLPSYYPMLLDMLYVPFVGGRWDFVPKLIHGWFGFLTGMLLYAYLSLRLSPVYGLLGWFFIVSMPIVVRLSGQAYVDLGLSFFATASLLGILLWKETQAQSWLAVAGIMAGFALATKPNGILFFLLASLLLLREMSAVRALRSWWPGAALFAAAAVVAYGPWLVRNFFWTGNPMFPFFTNWFGGGERVGGDPGLGILATRGLAYGESWWEIALLPLRLFFFGRDDQPQRFDGVLNPVLVLFLPWAFRGKWQDEKRLLFLFSICYLAYALFLTDIRVRYLLPIVPPLIVLLVYAVHNIYLRIRRPAILISGLALLAALNLAYAGWHVSRVAPMGYLLGQESREDYLMRALAEYPVLRYVNDNLPGSARLYLLFVGRRGYYCRREYFHDHGELPWFLIRAIDRAHDPEGVARELQGMGLTHLMIREDLLGKFLNENLDAGKQRLWQSFAARSLKGLVHANGYSVYQIAG